MNWILEIWRLSFFGGQYLAKSLIFGHKCHFRCKKSMGQCVLYMQIFAFSFCRVERLLLNLFTVCIRFVRIMRINQPSLLRTPKTQMFSWMTSLTKSKVFGVWSVLKKRWTPIQCKFSITSPPFNPINHDICCCRKITRLLLSMIFLCHWPLHFKPACHPSLVYYVIVDF